jgi:hypothetical protein
MGTALSAQSGFISIVFEVVDFLVQIEMTDRFLELLHVVDKYLLFNI